MVSVGTFMRGVASLIPLVLALGQSGVFAFDNSKKDNVSQQLWYA